MNGPWREPAEETIGLYPHLVVHDGRQSGSITFGRTRLPIWAPQWELVDLDDYTHPDDPEDEWREAGEAFVRHVLDMRGEFARLLLVLAAAEEKEEDARDVIIDRLDDGSGLVDITDVNLPSWWDTPEMAQPVIDQLRRCLAVLGASEVEP